MSPAMTTANTPNAWLPDADGTLILQPLSEESIAIQAIGGQPIYAKEGTHTMRVPIITADPTVAWVAEGEDINESELGQDEDQDGFHKAAGLTVITRELANDSNPAVAEQVGLGLARSIAKKIDLAFFAGRGATDTKPPRGLNDMTARLNAQTIAEADLADLDVFVAATMDAEAKGARLASFVTGPTLAEKLLLLRKATGSNEPLLQPDPTQPARRLINGVPLLVSSAVPAGMIWGVPADQRAQIIIREDVSIETDKSVYFTSDRIAIKATARVTTLYPHAETIQKIIVTA